MESEIPARGDSELRDRILTGAAAVAELEVRFRQPLERFLLGLCDRSDGRSQEKAIEIAGQILAECFVKSPSLLERWQGPDNLEAFLRTAARNRLKSWWGSAEKKRIEVNSESLSLARATMPDTGFDEEETELAGQALRKGVETAMNECPEGLVFMRLKGLHGVDQRTISRCWGHHETQTSRRIKEAMEIIRTKALEVVASKDGEASLDLLQHALQRDPQILLGRDDADGTHGEYQSLKFLAEGAADEKARRNLAEMMCRDPQMLGFFARLLNRTDERDALVVKDAALSGVAARLKECLRRSIEILQPSEAAGLVTPVISASFADLLVHLGADGGTLWLLCPGAAVLEAVFNPLEPEIAGKRQPLASGIVSLVIATGEAVCVTGVASHQRHSAAIDIAMGKTTRGMIAVPFVLGETVRGVLTAVSFTHEEGFGGKELERVVRYSQILTTLMEQNLTAKILA
ncbi:MAG: hypothetical protein V4819_07265 [Verrucomicrobiota bacterium]